MTKEQLEAKIKELEATINQLKLEKEEAQQMVEVVYECVQKLEQKYKKSVNRELSYREMLFHFNHANAKDLLKDYISKDALKVQFYGAYNFRSN
jgi:predicted ribosome quality control (RQC) complex YloA/Tae2 family protein